jgi:hypothetical protein
MANTMIFVWLKGQRHIIHPDTNVPADTGYQGLQRIHAPSKRPKKNPFTKEAKKNNRQLASEPTLNENVIGVLKRFKIIYERYRKRRKRFALRFNLIAGIYNLQLTT